jgi:SAM-dependent methyltransferase
VVAPPASDSSDAAPQADPNALRLFYEERYSGAYMAEHPRVAAERVRDVLSTIPASGVESILDYGCGRGFWTPILHEAFPAAVVTGIDISETAIERARAAFPTARFSTFDGRRAPYPDAAFSLVFSFHVLEHVLDLAQSLDDIARLVSPHGSACLILPCGNEGSFEHTIARLTNAMATSPTGEMRFRFEDDGHLRRLRSTELVAPLRRRNLELVSASFANHRWGAIEFIARSDPAFIRRFAATGSQARPFDRGRIALTRTFLLVLSQIVRVHRVAREGTTAARGAKAAVARLLRPAEPVLAPIVRALERRSAREWSERRHDPRGSAQYLVLRRADPSL